MTRLLSLLMIFACGAAAWADEALPDAAIGNRDRKRLEVQSYLQRYMESHLNSGYDRTEIQVSLKVRWEAAKAVAKPVAIKLGNLDIDSFVEKSETAKPLLDSVVAIEVALQFPAWFPDESVTAFENQAVNLIPLVAKQRISVKSTKTPVAPQTFRDYARDPSVLTIVLVGGMFLLVIVMIVMLFLDSPAPTRVIVQVPQREQQAAAQLPPHASTGLTLYKDNVVRMAPGEAVREDED